MARAKQQGESAFLDYYRNLFESDKEFEGFLKALKSPTRSVLRFAPKNEKALKQVWKKAGLKWKTLEWYPYALKWPEGYERGEELPGMDDYLFYVQNASSLLAVLALDPQPEDLILDACAAPGGKALFIAELMAVKNGKDVDNDGDEGSGGDIDETGELITNDRSDPRRGRMKKVFEDYGVDSFVTVMGRNAMAFGKSHPDYFDKILLDAPCSSEKHVISSTKHLGAWKLGRIKHLKKQQFQMIKVLFRALKPGGRLVYATCAVTPEENEEVIQKFLKKSPDTVRQIPLPDSIPHENGRIYPHQFPNMDPMFVAILEKIE